MLGIMYGEGSFNSGSPFLDPNKVNSYLSSCALLPNCDSNASLINNIVPFFRQYWDDVNDAVKIIDPTRTPNACNLLDGIFALAKTLASSQYGSGSFAGKTCFGIPLNSGSGGSSSCSWSPSGVETAIRVWEFGTAYNSTYTCATAENSCATGGMTAVCPGGDNCETINKRYSDPSHNGCVYYVYDKNK
jgi:hypothetical protein